MNIKAKFSQKTLFLIFYIYPIVPLGLLAAWPILLSINMRMKSSQAYNLDIKGAIVVTLLFILFFGGVVGLYAGFKALLKQNTKTVFWLFLYATLSYLAYVIYTAYGAFFHFLALFSQGRSLLLPDTLYLVNIIYFLLGLIIIGRQLVVVYRDVYGSSSQQSEPTPNIKNTHEGRGDIS